MASIDFNTPIASGAAARRQPHLRAIDGMAGEQPPPHPHLRQQPGEAEGAPAPGGGAGRLVQLAGALTSLALIGGLIWWGYELVMRDVNGIPVVRALEGPLRVQPEDPGGELARYQGLSVNRIQAGGNAAPAPDRLVLAPRPVDVIESDPPGISPRPSPRPGPAPAGGAAGDESPQATAATETTAPAEAAEATAATAALPGDSASAPPAAAASGPVSAEAASPSEIAAAARALVAAIANEEGAPGEAAAAKADALAPAPEAAKPQVIPASVPGVRRSPRPMARPAGLERFAAMARASEPVKPQPPGEIDPASLPPRTSLAQLGAFDSAAIARREWERLTARFPDYFSGKARVIEEAVTGGRRFFRLRVHGFSDMADARRFCSALRAQEAVCIPVMTR